MTAPTPAARIRAAAEILRGRGDVESVLLARVFNLCAECWDAIEVAQVDDMLAAIWLYVNWRYVTKQLTTPQKERWVVAIQRSGDPEDPVDVEGLDLWWRDAPTAVAPADPPAPAPAVIDAAHLTRQRAFSERTFGPGRRTGGVLDHIRKELREIEAAPDDLSEWVDVVILALDGAWRHGGEPQQILDAIIAKQARNEARTWPDWRGASEDQAIEHDRTDETPGVRVVEGGAG